MTREKQHESEDEKSKKIDISPTQVAGGALASVTAAFLGSHLGVAGTFWGAGLTSVVITVGGAVYQRSLERTKVKANVAAKAALKKAGGTETTQRASRASTEDADRESAARPDPASEATRRIEAPETASSGMQWPGGEHVVDESSATQRIDPDRTTKIDQDDKTRVLRWDGTQYVPAARSEDSADGGGEADERTELVSRSEDGTELVGRTEDRTEIVEPEETSGTRKGLIRWGAVALTAALAFGLGMLIVTGVEGVTGRPLSGGGGGTTVGRVFQPVQPPTAPVAPPEESPSQEQRPSQPPETSSTVPPSREPTSSQPTTGAPVPPGQPTSPETQTTPPQQESPGTTEPQQVPQTGAFGAGSEAGQ